MHARFALILSALFGCAAAAESAAPRPAPQPRLRLDPVSHAAVAAPVTQDKMPGGAPAVVMDKFIVNENALPREPSHPEEQKGRFSLLNGGYLLQGELGKSQWEIGAWPWLPWTDVMWSDLKHFPKQKTRVDMEFVRIHW